MRLSRARVQNYRSIMDSGWFNVEEAKSILVGPNEAGKSAVLQALLRLNPAEEAPLDALRDMPRRLYNDLDTGKLSARTTPVVTGDFEFSEKERQSLARDVPALKDATGYRRIIYMTGQRTHQILGGPTFPTLGDLEGDLRRLHKHVAQQLGEDEENPAAALVEVLESNGETTAVREEVAKRLSEALTACVAAIDEDNTTESNRLTRLREAVDTQGARNRGVAWAEERLPTFVYFSNYYRVRPKIHLARLAKRQSQNLLDDDRYDYGNLCLLQLLGIDLKQLAKQGQEADIDDDTPEGIDEYARALEQRMHKLNAASVQLTEQIRHLWQDDDLELVIKADGQLLTVLVRDELGVEIELDQRSEGFQWCTSFWIVFAAEAEGDLENAVLLLDEPGVSLHGLKQTGFRETMSRLAEDNQLLFTTHSPFMVGPDELSLVRVVEMPDRTIGTKVHNEPAANQGAALLPLQEALGYDLAHAMFTATRNFVLEGITDYWYLDALDLLAGQGDEPRLNERIVKHFAGGAGKVAYYATILHASGLKVVALLDSDSQGDAAAKMEGLINLGNKNVLRTADYLPGQVTAPETEDLLRHTLSEIAAGRLNWDVRSKVAEQPGRPLVDIFEKEFSDFSKARLAKAFVRWAGTHTFADLRLDEREAWNQLVETVNRRLR